jgi:hypothetical protein
MPCLGNLARVEPGQSVSAAPPVADPARAFRSIRSPASALRWLFYALIAVTALAVVADVVEYRFYSGYAEDELVERDAEVGVLIFGGIVAAVQGGLWIAVVVLWIIWFHRAYTNLRPLGVPELRFGTGWAIGAWFVPVLNLWRPKQIANDIWRGSDPEAGAQMGSGWREKDVPAVFQWWWAAFLVSQWVGNVAVRAAFRAESAPELANAAVAYGISDAFDALAAVLALTVVSRTTDRQEERARRVGTPANLAPWTTTPSSSG